MAGISHMWRLEVASECSEVRMRALTFELGVIRVFIRRSSGSILRQNDGILHPLQGADILDNDTRNTESLWIFTDWRSYSCNSLQNGRLLKLSSSNHSSFKSVERQFLAENRAEWRISTRSDDPLWWPPHWASDQARWCSSWKVCLCRKSRRETK